MMKAGMIVGAWAVLLAMVVFYLEAWQWTVGPFECGAELLRFTRSPCLPGELG